MIQLIIQIIIFFFFYRIYKRFRGEWGGWYVTFASWVLLVYIICGMSMSLFWEYSVQPFTDGLYWLYISGTFIVVWFAIYNIALWIILGARLTEYWWSFLLRWTKQLILLNWNQYYYFNCRWTSQRWFRWQFWTKWVCICRWGLNFFLIYCFNWIFRLAARGGIRGDYDTETYEGWYHYYYWTTVNWNMLPNYFILLIIILILVRGFFLCFCYALLIKDIELGAHYKLWYQRGRLQDLSIYDYLHPLHKEIVGTADYNIRWFAGDFKKFYEWPLTWTSFLCYVTDWDHKLALSRRRHYYYWGKESQVFKQFRINRGLRAFAFWDELNNDLICQDKDYCKFGLFELWLYGIPLNKVLREQITDLFAYIKFF
jgi:hypothetical protein